MFNSLIMNQGYRALKVYRKAFKLTATIFELTKKFPEDEKYALSDQLRRSSRSICRAIGEGYRKRQYPKHFSSKMSDADMENTETQISLDLAMSCNYINEEEFNNLLKDSEEIGRMLNHMINNPELYKKRGKHP